MAEKASWTMQLKIDGGPALSAANQVTVEAYDKASIDLTKGAAKTLQVQPAPGLAKYLVVVASAYSDPNDAKAKLSFKFAKIDGSAIGNDIQLDDALVVTGQPALASIAQDWTGLTFTSTFADAITVNVLVCRAAAAA
jgi:hypothetical protein